jgi:hypothetical protein
MIALSVVECVVLNALLYSAYTDSVRQDIDDRATAMIFLCAPTLKSLGYGVILAIFLSILAKITHKIGQGDALLLGALSCVMSTEQYVIFCLSSTAILYGLTMYRGSQAYPMCPIFLFVFLGMIFYTH